ncbi:MAG: CotH kinase family protein [Oscillospiraceae bacterium]|nr:CotH kinase family protein [Oscillospiraceae bacterium]
MKLRSGFQILIPAAAALCFAGISVFLCSAEDTPAVSLSVSGVFPQPDAASAQVHMTYIDWDHSWYLFLPASADRAHLTVSYEVSGDAKLLLNQQEIISGAETDLLGSADTFTLQAGEHNLGTLHVMQSNLGCMYVSLPPDGLGMLTQEKETAVTGDALMLGADGSVQYRGALEKIKGRGNSSWYYAEEKKPYNFKLPEKTALFGMGAAKKWSLLSNYLDHAMLRNEIAFAMSRNAGLTFTPDAVFIDLYLDGDYRGVYQLTERVQVHPERVGITDLEKATQALNEKPLGEYRRQTVGGTLNGEENGSYQYYEIPNDPEDITGGYLLEFQVRSRAKNGEFVTDRGVIFDVCSPEYASKAQTEYIRGFVQALEDAVYSDTGCNSLGRHYSEYLDVDSLALGYLIQEITENTDGFTTSFYFYKESDLTGDGKLHYGPVWDFDLAFQNYSMAVTDPDGETHYSVVPETIYARYVPVSGYSPETAPLTGITDRSWILRLWGDDAFARRAALLYEQKFDAYLAALTDPSGGIMQMRDAIAPAAEMNRIRWHMFGGKPYKPIGPENGTTYAECVEYIRSNLAKRRAFLHDAFLAETVQRCLASLTRQTTGRLTEYDTEEQKTVSVLKKSVSDKLKAAESSAAAEQLMQDAERELAAIPRAFRCGDFNDDGTVSLEDAQMLLIYYAETVAGNPVTLTATQRRNGDTDQNGALDVADAMHILLHYTAELSGTDYPLPVSEENKTAAGPDE